MAHTGGGAPPIFADTAKFNGANWVTWKGLIKIAADLRGAYGYLDGLIVDPLLPTTPAVQTPAPTTTTMTTAAQTPAPTSTDTPWESTMPSPAKWRTLNAWAKGLLFYNTTDPVSLGINIHGMAVDAWKSYMGTYEIVSEIAILNAESDLQNMRFTDDQDFIEFISHIHTRWSNATAIGATIDNKSFCSIVLNALPCSWDPIVATLYTIVTNTILV